MSRLVRLQQIKRKNGKHIYYVVLPKRLVEKLGWGKGDVLAVEEIIVNDNLVTGRKCIGVMIYRIKDYEESRIVPR